MKFAKIQKLNQRHYKILDLYIQGLSTKEIAKTIGLTKEAISMIIGSPSFQHEAAIRRKNYEETLDEKLAEQTSQASKILAEHAAEAATTLVEVMNTGSPGVRVRSAEAILDRTGHSRKTQSENNDSTIINLKREDVELLNETLKLEKEIIETTKPKEVVSETVNETIESAA